MSEYRFTEARRDGGDVRLEWIKDDQPFDPLDFWIVPAPEVEQAKARVRAEEFE